MCVDFRALNKITRKDKYPLPLIEDQIDRLGGHKYFITLDLSQGFYQIPLSEESVPKTGFVTPDGHFEFLRMPFGLANAPSEFQRLMNVVLNDYINTIAQVYIDDIIIPARDFEEGLNRLRKILENIRTLKTTWFNPQAVKMFIFPDASRVFGKRNFQKGDSTWFTENRGRAKYART
jgi:hypothetical protein